MAKVIKLRKGLDVKLKGTASLETATVSCPGEYALVPDDFVGVKPKVVVKEGDSVKAGDALFVDKLHPEVKFVSPVSGTVSLVERGDRRKLLSIRVKADKEQVAREFDVKSDVKALLMERGLFAFFRSRPYDVVANPDDKPKAIFVTAFNSMPLSQDFAYVVRGQEQDFQAGITALSKLARVELGISKAETMLADVKDCQVTIYDGPAPAGNVGVQINHTSPINKGEVVWTLSGEEVLFIGRLLRTGKVDLTRTIALAGSEVKAPKYYKVKVGQQLTTLLSGNVVEAKYSQRIINGNVMTGFKTTADSYLAAHATEVNIIPEGDDVDEFMGWISPFRLKQFSTSSAPRRNTRWMHV